MSTQPSRRPEDETGIPQWRGLAIGIEERGGTFLYRVRMVHDDPVNATLLVQTEDEKEAVIAWRYWSATLRLPRLIERAPDDFHAMEWRLGALVVRSRTPRRRGSPLFSRRPRRMRTRAIGRSGATSIYRDEREIIARN
jgi:hypothetical protein